MNFQSSWLFVLVFTTGSFGAELERSTSDRRIVCLVTALPAHVSKFSGQDTEPHGSWRSMVGASV